MIMCLVIVFHFLIMLRQSMSNPAENRQNKYTEMFFPPYFLKQRLTYKCDGRNLV